VTAVQPDGSSAAEGRSVMQERIIEVIRGLGVAEVVSYGDVADDAGYPGRARLVGHVCASVDDLPWWRVVTANGRLVPGLEVEHAQRLRAEGVAVEGGRVRHPRFVGRS
jgi:methylated-DNA-protein-cysteine methyltransferase-like protein